MNGIMLMLIPVEGGNETRLEIGEQDWKGCISGERKNGILQVGWLQYEPADSSSSSSLSAT